MIRSSSFGAPSDTMSAFTEAITCSGDAADISGVQTLAFQGSRTGCLRAESSVRSASFAV